MAASFGPPPEGVPQPIYPLAAFFGDPPENAPPPIRLRAEGWDNSRSVEELVPASRPAGPSTANGRWVIEHTRQGGARRGSSVLFLGQSTISLGSEPDTMYFPNRGAQPDSYAWLSFFRVARAVLGAAAEMMMGRMPDAEFL